MRLYRDLPAAKIDAASALERVVTVGFFDGVHLGHQELFRQLRLWAAERACQPVVVTFEPHPLEVLVGSRPLSLLSLKHRLLLLAQEGIAATLVLPFSRQVAAWSPDDFVHRVLVKGLHARHVLMGFDSAWGAQRQGTFEYYRERSMELGVEVRRAGVRRLAAERVSSTLVRDAVVAGDLPRLKQLLGRRYSILGDVTSGAGRGREIGFPTANIDTDEALLPPGVYFAEVTRWGRIEVECEPGGQRTLPSVAPAERLGAVVNIGRRPTFDGDGGDVSVEVHLVDFSGDLYGECLEIHFLQAHRGERRFDSIDGLVAQIATDVRDFRAAWRRDT